MPLSVSSLEYHRPHGADGLVRKNAVRCDYLAYYDMDRSTAEKRTAFLEKVMRAFEAW